MYKASSVIRNEGKIAKEANKKRERERKLGDTKMVREFCELLLQSRPCYNLEWTRNSEEKFKFENFRAPSFPRLVIRFLAAYLAALTLLTRLSRPRSCNRIKNPSPFE